MAHDKEPEPPIRSSFSNDPEMLELIEYFVSELPERVSALNDCWKNGRLDDLRRLAHQLKGASGGYGFESLGDAAARLEEAIDMQADVDRLQGEVEELLEMCRRATM
jgi:HPt (histidine-containing phosphotransfer) domain-containing protein